MIRDLLGILGVTAEMVRMGRPAIQVTLDPLVQQEIRAPRGYKDPLEMLDLLAPRYVNPVH